MSAPQASIDDRAGDHAASHGSDRALPERARACWHIITCEYPPQPGGVSDYTYAVAQGLAAQGDQVHVWCPAHDEPPVAAAGVVAHRELGRFTPRDLRRVEQALERFPGPRQLLVQWVPHGYGYRSMNLGFCWWLRNRAVRHGDRVEIMLHEPFLPFRGVSIRQNAAALVHRLMTVILLRAAELVWMTIPLWEQKWRPYALERRIPFQWLPIPSNIPVIDDPAGIQAVRRRYVAGQGFLIGHFGTFGRPITSVLEPVLRALLAETADQTILLMGRGSHEFREQLVRNQPRWSERIQAAGALPPEDLSRHLSACDLLIQPYPDGVTTRRGSIMAGLNHGKAVVTTHGELTDSFWTNTGALALAESGDTQGCVRLIQQLRADASERLRLGTAARVLYQQRLDVSHTIAALRRTGAAGGDVPCAS